MPSTGYHHRNRPMLNLIWLAAVAITLVVVHAHGPIHVVDHAADHRHDHGIATAGVHVHHVAIR